MITKSKRNTINTNQMNQTRIPRSSLGARSGAIKLAEDMKSRDEADEAEAHNKHDGRRDLQSRSIVGVESQHVASGTRSTAERSRAWSSSGSSRNPTAAHSCSGGGGSAWSNHARPRCGRRRRLGLRRTSDHFCRAKHRKKARLWQMRVKAKQLVQRWSKKDVTNYWKIDWWWGVKW